MRVKLTDLLDDLELDPELLPLPEAKRVRVDDAEGDRLPKLRQAVMQRVQIPSVPRRKLQKLREPLVQRLAAVDRPAVKNDFHQPSSP